VVVHIPMRLRRRNGRCMVLTEGEAAPPVSAAQHVEDINGANRTLIEAIAKGYRWQAQLESGEYASLEDLAKDIGCDRTYGGRMLRPRACVALAKQAASRRTSSRRSCAATNRMARAWRSCGSLS